MSPVRSAAPLLAVAALAACVGGALRPERAPLGRLPGDVRPERYALELEIFPDREHFSGEARIALHLDRARRTLWLHGLALDVTAIALELPDGTAVPAAWERADASGVAAVRLGRAVGPGRATLRVAYRARFDHDLRGLYRVDAGGRSYAFTQFEPLAARRAFPGFDEPGFKTPFEVTLTVRDEHVAIANTPVVAETSLAGAKRIRFAVTPPLPTYLVAWAVGPLDVVEAPDLAPDPQRPRPVPFRGVAAEGRGGGLAYALAHTPPLLAYLERYFGDGYPYAKLDVIAVPDFAAGAMENVGAITFRESLLLLDEKSAPEEQRRGFAYVMAHELAHQWFGNLVTPRWWDDVWLNESFASWMGYRAVEAVFPEHRAELGLLESVQRAMDVDSRVSARRVREPIESPHDIHSAFDPITYDKGAGVLAMLERWLGADVFRDGVRRYLARHRGGNASADDLMEALSVAAGRDVATPFRSFIDRPGLPFVEVRVGCQAGRGTLELRQSRYLPLGSAGSRDAGWQVPICARYAVRGDVRESCRLLEAREGRLALEGGGCPDWVMPNADAAGYYRWSLSTADRERLVERGFAALTPRERLSLADSLEAAFRTGALDAGALFALLDPLARDPNRAVAVAPMAPLRLAWDHLVGAELRPAVGRFAGGLYAPVVSRLGYVASPGEDGETRLLRAAVLDLLARVARDAQVRREAVRRGRLYAGLAGAPEPDAVDPEWVTTALAVTVQEGGAAVFDALEQRLAVAQDALERSRLLEALGAAPDPELAARARALSLDSRLRESEMFAPLRAQLAQPETRDATWRWIRDHYDRLVERAGPALAARLPRLAGVFCERGRADEIEAFFAHRIQALEGGPRSLAGALEEIRLCAALADHQRASAREFFATRAPDAAR